ncbi:hypothetical protein BWP39_13290 [Paraburkholderia acidicola]|uniref:NHL repeat-containing protein n=1 Tax=Paraburkholderia acidicola TaxID=1912599 RepID=A0A2A4EZB9_9BURK|nr:hypothetical protein [Paraburkholderia acidicola]PCE25496.1 hypothetical protein BWP39_13290 [Paraburkholderia acidicola]
MKIRPQQSQQTRVRISALLAILVATCSLAACGSGGDGDDDSSPPPVNPNAPSISVYAGQPDNPGSTTGAIASALFDTPTGLIVDNTGKLFVADNGNFTVSEITNGVVTTLAGTAGANGSADGLGAAAQFGGPEELAVDATDNVYVTDDVAGSDFLAVRKITASGQVTTVTNPATGQALLTDGSAGIAVDQQSNAYVFTTDTSTGANVLTQITPSGAINVIQLVNSSGTPVGLIDPQDMTVDSSNHLYIADDDINANAGVLYQVALNGTTGVVTALAGSTATSGATDGPGTAATFNGLGNLTTDSSGNVYANDVNNGTIREISPAGIVTTVAGIAGQFGLNLGQLPRPLPTIDALAIVGQTLYTTAPNHSVVLQIAPLP